MLLITSFLQRNADRTPQLKVVVMLPDSVLMQGSITIMLLEGETEMKMYVRSMLIAASMVLLVAPISVKAQNPPPDLDVSDPQFTYDVNARFNSRAPSSGEQGIPTTIVTESPVQRVSALFRNAGTKIIKSIEWEYIVFKDAKEMEVRHVYRIRSNKTVLPGEAARLGKAGYRLHDSQYKKARVTLIEYAGGTTWQGAEGKGIR